MKKFQPVQSLVLLAVAFLVLLGGPAGAEIVDKIVAVVNDQIITLSELEQMSRSIQAQPGMGQQFKGDQALQRQMLDALIDRKLAKDEAKRRGIVVSEKEIQQALERLRQAQGLADDAALAQALSRSGLTLDELKQQIVDQITTDRLIQVVVGGKVTVSEADVRRFYDSQYPKQAGDRLHLRVLNLAFPPGATDAQKQEIALKAEILVKELQQGTSFDQIQQKHALPVADMGFIALTDLDPQLARHLERLRPKELAPVQTPQGFQIIQVVDRKAGAARSFEEAAPEIRQFLMRQEMERLFADWAKSLREKAHIKIMM